MAFSPAEQIDNQLLKKQQLEDAKPFYVFFNP